MGISGDFLWRLDLKWLYLVDEYGDYVKFKPIESDRFEV